MKNWKMTAVFITMITGITLLALSIHRKVNTVNNTVKTLPTYDLPSVNNKNVPVNAKEKNVFIMNVPESRVVVLSGEISENASGVAAAITQKANQKVPDNQKAIILLISSPGGSIIDGAAIINSMEASPVPIYTVCVDLCASMAAIIHQYGEKRLMMDRSVLMFHDAAGGFDGYFPHINSRFTTISKYVLRFNMYISRKVGIPVKELEAMEHKEFWIDSEDATEQNYNDHLVYVNILTNKNKVSDIHSLMNTDPKKTNKSKYFDLNWTGK